MKALALLGVIMACGSEVTAPQATATYCVVDSTIDYTSVATDGSASEHYLAGSGVSAYRLTLESRGAVIPAGALTGVFDVTDSLGDPPHQRLATFNLPGDTVNVWWSPSPPGIAGRWAVIGDSLQLRWPYPQAGPTWFWELARHSAPADGTWVTVLEYRDPGFSTHLRFEWRPC